MGKLTKNAKEKILKQTGYGNKLSGQLMAKGCSSTIEDLEWLKKNGALSDEFVFVRRTADELVKFSKGSMNYGIITNSGQLIIVDDIDLEYKDVDNESEEPENTIYTIFGDIMTNVSIHDVNHDDYFNILAPIESSLYFERSPKLITKKDGISIPFDIKLELHVDDDNIPTVDGVSEMIKAMDRVDLGEMILNNIDNINVKLS